MPALEQNHRQEQKNILKALGLRRTKDRQTILMRFHKKRTWSLPQLMKELPKTDKSTIFRNLQFFLKHDIITPVHVHDGAHHYELAGRGHHDHMVCEQCDAASCVDCPAPNLPKHHLELVGLCPQCR